MAARNKLTHDYKTRQKIQTTQIVNRLTKHIHGEIELSNTQIRAAEILLRKSLPDLTSISGTLEVADAREMTTAQIIRELQGLGYGQLASNGTAAGTEKTH